MTPGICANCRSSGAATEDAIPRGPTRIPPAGNYPHKQIARKQRRRDYDFAAVTAALLARSPSRRAKRAETRPAARHGPFKMRSNIPHSATATPPTRVRLSFLSYSRKAYARHRCCSSPLKRYAVSMRARDQQAQKFAETQTTARAGGAAAARSGDCRVRRRHARHGGRNGTPQTRSGAGCRGH